MDKKQKILIIIIAAIVVIGGAIGGYFGYSAYQEKKQQEEIEAFLKAIEEEQNSTINAFNDKINGIQLKEGDTKTYETKDYLIIYEVKSFNGFGEPFWEFKEIINKNN